MDVILDIETTGLTIFVCKKSLLLHLRAMDDYF